MLPRYHPALLTASLEFCEHAMALLSELVSQPVNRMKVAHEGLLGPIVQHVTSPQEPFKSARDKEWRYTILLTSWLLRSGAAGLDVRTIK